MSAAVIDPADLAALRAEMAEANADPAMLRGLAEQDADEARLEADRLFGTTLREAITEAHGPEIAAAVLRAFTEATRPSTPARKRQDRIHKRIVARLNEIAGEAP